VTPGLTSRQRIGRSAAGLVVAGFHLALFALLARSVDHVQLSAFTGDGGGTMTAGLVRASTLGLRSTGSPSPRRSALDVLNAQLSGSAPQTSPNASATAPDGSSVLQQMATSLAPSTAHSASVPQSPTPPAAAEHSVAGPAGGNPWAHASVMSGSYREGQILAKIQPCWAAMRAHLPLQVRLTINAQGAMETIVPISSVGPSDRIVDAAVRAIRACGPYPTSGSDSAVYSLLLPAFG
jgi:hypothetical protein